MTVPSDNNRNDEIGNGATDTYNYTFKITSESDMKVSQRDTEDVETVLTLNVDYTVTGVGALNGGSIVLTAGNLTTDYHLTIRRDSALTQQTDIRNQGDFLPEIHEDTFDHLASADQTQQSEIDRCVKVSETYPVDVELPGPQAGKVISWNAAGDALINVDPGSVALAIPADDSVTPAKIQSGLPFVFPETLVLKRGSDVASASALPVINDGNYVDVTGSADIDSIDSIGVGTWLMLQFDAALNLNHSAVNLFLCAGGANILTAAGDHALFVEYGIGTWRCVSYVKANGQPIVLTGITFTNPVLAAATLNTSVEGTAFQDDDSFGSAAANKFASSESIKAYVDTNTTLPTHDHNGGDGAPIPQGGIGISAVGRAELKTATSSQSVAVGDGLSATIALTGGIYSMWTAGTSSRIIALSGGGDLAAGVIGFGDTGSAGGGFAYVDSLYIQSSPPYKIGDVTWGHFFYVLRNKSTGEIFGTSEGEDPTWAYSGAIWVKDKNSIERMAAAPHPFADYWDKPLPDELEICLVDMRDFNIAALKLECLKKKKKADREILEYITIGSIESHKKYNLPDIPGFTDKVKIRKHN